MRCSMAMTVARAAASSCWPTGVRRAGRAVRRARRPGHQPAVLQPAQHHVHRLPGDERAPGKFGVGQARSHDRHRTRLHRPAGTRRRRGRRVLRNPARPAPRPGLTARSRGVRHHADPAGRPRAAAGGEPGRGRAARCRGGAVAEGRRRAGAARQAGRRRCPDRLRSCRWAVIGPAHPPRGNRPRNRRGQRRAAQPGSPETKPRRSFPLAWARPSYLRRCN
jgi:hypothetical protein